jgi:hypothetical protein
VLKSRRYQVNAIGEIVLDLPEVIGSSEKTAIWKSKDSDRYVTVIGDLGVGPDGRHYVSVRDTLTGIPLDELEL